MNNAMTYLRTVPSTPVLNMLPLLVPVERLMSPATAICRWASEFTPIVTDFVL